MKFSIYKFADKTTVGEIDALEELLEVKVDNEFLSMHFARMKAAHLSTRKAKTRNQSEVKATTAKPYKQKGTGRARRGTMVAAHHVGGGTMFGPRGGTFKVSIPKKEARLAKKMLLSLAIKQGKFFVLDNYDMPDSKTKTLVSRLNNFVEKDKPLKCLFLYEGELSSANILSSRNLRDVKYSSIKNFTVYDIMSKDVVFITKEALLNLVSCVK